MKVSNKESCRRWRQKNRESYNRYMREYRKRNKGKVKKVKVKTEVGLAFYNPNQILKVEQEEKTEEDFRTETFPDTNLK